jgi:hypothetical protein
MTDPWSTKWRRRSKINGSGHLLADLGSTKWRRRSKINGSGRLPLALALFFWQREGGDDLFLALCFSPKRGERPIEEKS